MKKGFTLIELLIIMVIVTVLVTMAMPRYKTAMEKGRGLAGIANTASVSDAVNTYYIKNYNSYGNSWQALCAYALGDNSCSAASPGNVASLVKTTYFSVPSITVADGVVTVQTTRQGLGETKTYTLYATSANGEVTDRYCMGYAPYCNALGAGTVRAAGGWSF